jgi:hypothetical protein
MVSIFRPKLHTASHTRILPSWYVPEAGAKHAAHICDEGTSKRIDIIVPVALDAMLQLSRTPTRTGCMSLSLAHAVSPAAFG